MRCPARFGWGPGVPLARRIHSLRPADATDVRGPRSRRHTEATLKFEVRRYTDPAGFRSDAREYLLRDEARHNLLLGLLETLVDQPDVYSAYSVSPSAIRLVAPIPITMALAAVVRELRLIV